MTDRRAVAVTELLVATALLGLALGAAFAAHRAGDGAEQAAPASLDSPPADRGAADPADTPTFPVDPRANARTL